MTNAQFSADPSVDASRRIVPDTLSRILAVPVTILLAALIRKAWRDVDVTWDSFAYHLPLAALRTGIISQAQYHLSAHINSIYQGFPALSDLIQGFLWRITGRPQGANFIGLLGLLFFTLLVRKLFRIPAPYLLICLLSIPVVLIQSTSAYIDLFGNCLLSALILLIFAAWLWPEKVSAGQIILVVAIFSAALNTKVGYLLIAPVALLLFALLLYRQREKLATLRVQWTNAGSLARVLVIAIVVALIGLGFVNEVKDAVAFHNPVYPADIKLGSIHLKGTLGEGHEPAYLAHSPQFVRWLLSILEYKAFEGRVPLWTSAQGDVPADSPAMRMGGFFSPLVLFNILWFCPLQSKLRRKYGWKPAYFLCLLTVLTAVLPGSQESRYYMYWLFCLITTNLLLITQGLQAEESKSARVIFLGTTATFLSFVLCSTGFTYIRSSHLTIREVSAMWGVDASLAAAPPHEEETICVLGKNRTSFMYAPIFHPELAAKTHYRVMEGYSSDDCHGARILP